MVRPVALGSLFLCLFACGDDTANSGGSNSGGAGQGGAATTSATNSTGTSTASTAGQGGAGGGACLDPGTLEFGPGPNNEPNCLAYAGAGKLCGFQSDEAICTFAVGCGASADLGQCKINCEMGTTVNCYQQADIDCVIAATCANDCVALAACGFIL